MMEVATVEQILSDRSLLDAYLERFLMSLDVRESSKITYKRQLQEFLLWINKTQCYAPCREHILSYREHLHGSKHLSSLTVGGYLTALRRFFEWLEGMKIYPNVARGVRGPKKRPGFKKDALSADQVRLLLGSIDRSDSAGKRDFAMINLMIRTGLRTIEIVRATAEDISGHSGERVLWVHGKGRDSKDEFVVLTPRVLDPLYDYLETRGPVRGASPLFVSLCSKNAGQRLTTRSVSRICKERLVEAGFNDRRLTAHSLRHTAITLSLLAGATPQEARTMARHTDINTTLIYAHNINRIAQAPEHKIDAFLEF